MAADDGLAGRQIREEFERRDANFPDAYALSRPHVLFAYQGVSRALIDVLHRSGALTAERRRALEIGCAGGTWLATMEHAGLARSDLAGIDLDPARAEVARRRLADVRDQSGQLLAGGADIRVGDASSLPWEDHSFGVVAQLTAFSSMLDPAMRRRVAQEMVRVLQPDGVILWYDFAYNNPRNHRVRGIRRKEIRALFPGLRMRARRITLAPPLARRIVPVTWLGALALERMRVLDTHVLAVLRRGDG